MKLDGKLPKIKKNVPIYGGSHDIVGNDERRARHAQIAVPRGKFASFNAILRKRIRCASKKCQSSLCGQA
jgi:hypothetical protein